MFFHYLNGFCFRHGTRICCRHKQIGFCVFIYLSAQLHFQVIAQANARQLGRPGKIICYHRYHQAGFCCLILCLLNCTAASIASTIASGLAIPLPAISKAVPWSTEVRMMGSPIVMFTPFTLSICFFSAFHLKPVSLNGICPWSWYIDRKSTRLNSSH